MKGDIMKQLTGIIILALAIFSFQLSASAADQLKIGVLDLQMCIQTSNEGKRIAESLKKKYTEMQDDLNKRQQELVEMQNDLEKQSLMLSVDAKEERQKEYDKKRRDLSYLLQDKNEEYKKAENDARVAILNVLSGVVETIAKEKNFDLITERANGGVLYVSKALDITDEVIAGLNKVKP
jgi:outer membrane protein